jgi:hypothetical protein
VSVSMQTRPTTEAGERPTSVKWTIWTLTFLGVTALGGGIEMLAFPQGNDYLPADMLEKIPFETFIVPGLILAGIFGLGSLFVAWGMWSRPEIGLLRWAERLTDRHWAWAGAIMLGLGFTMWMVIELSMLGAPWAQGDAGGEISAWILYGIYGTVTLALLVLPQLRPVRRYMLEDTSR